MFNITPVVRNLIIINVIVFLVQNFLPIRASWCDEFLYSPGLTGIISLWPIGSCAFAPYQFFTYMFAHGGMGHIFFNMMALASFGPTLEIYWGEKKFLLFYIVTGIGAGIIYASVNYWRGVAMGSMLGASGAVYGVLTAFGMLFPNLELTLMLTPIRIKAKYIVFLVGGLTYLTDRTGSVAHLAHLGGIIVAFAIVSIWRNDGRR
jgi:membrane associated rhomboid family serine protease